MKVIVCIDIFMEIKLDKGEAVIIYADRKQDKLELFTPSQMAADIEIEVARWPISKLYSSQAFVRKFLQDHMQKTEIVPEEKYAGEMARAMEIAGRPEFAPYIAAALASGIGTVWSDQPEVVKEGGPIRQYTSEALKVAIKEEKAARVLAIKVLYQQGALQETGSVPQDVLKPPQGSTNAVPQESTELIPDFYGEIIREGRFSRIPGFLKHIKQEITSWLLENPPEDSTQKRIDMLPNLRDVGTVKIYEVARYLPEEYGPGTREAEIYEYTLRNASKKAFEGPSDTSKKTPEGPLDGLEKAPEGALDTSEKTPESPLETLGDALKNPLGTLGDVLKSPSDTSNKTSKGPSDTSKIIQYVHVLLTFCAIDDKCWDWPLDEPLHFYEGFEPKGTLEYLPETGEKWSMPPQYEHITSEIVLTYDALHINPKEYNDALEKAQEGRWHKITDMNKFGIEKIRLNIDEQVNYMLVLSDIKGRDIQSRPQSSKDKETSSHRDESKRELNELEQGGSESRSEQSMPQGRSDKGSSSPEGKSNINILQTSTTPSSEVQPAPKVLPSPVNGKTAPFQTLDPTSIIKKIAWEANHKENELNL